VSLSLVLHILKDIFIYYLFWFGGGVFRGVSLGLVLHILKLIIYLQIFLTYPKFSKKIKFNLSTTQRQELELCIQIV